MGNIMKVVLVSTLQNHVMQTKGVPLNYIACCSNQPFIKYVNISYIQGVQLQGPSCHDNNSSRNLG